MNDTDNSIWMLFDSIIQDETEKRIMKLIIDGKTSKEIVEELLDVKSEDDLK